MPCNVYIKPDIRASVAARQLLRQADCDPRQPNLFGGIDIAAIDTNEMASLRDLLCAVLSVRDRRPWCSNGKRVTVGKLTVYLGMTFNFLKTLTKHFDLSNEILIFTLLNLLFIFHSCQVSAPKMVKLRAGTLSGILGDLPNVAVLLNFSLILNLA